ncbi:MAG: DUF5009 domain-containing protein [Bryobacteraceae bacterium]|nr:DUF5009 domain-containing protein [Bryobacterales bacterium]NUN01531.1 DUF5009 domain-containing protein [Bryobacteraceae bacterium]
MAAVTGVVSAPADVSVKLTKEAPGAGRLISLDAYRGFIMLLLISHGFGLSVLQNYPGWTWLANQVEHAAWEGCTFWDLIQPAFTFMVGVAMPLAFARRIAQGATSSALFRHVAWRAIMLVVLSNVLSNFNGSGPLRFQLINVLCQIAFAYFICYLIMQLPFRMQVLAGAGLLALHWVLFLLFPGPEGPFSKTDNIGAVIDRAVLGYNYSGYYTTINFIGNTVTVLFGVWTGMLLLKNKDHAFKLRLLSISAVSAFIIGLALTPANPMVKRLWTASFTFFSAGWVLLMLIAFYWLVEVKSYKRWTFFAVVVGANSIFIYSFAQVLRGWLNRGLGRFTGNFGFLGDLGAIPQNLLVMFVMWYLCYWLYKRKIFIKI